MDKYRQERVKRLQKYVSEQGLDAMLVTSQDAIYYLSGASYTPVERPFFTSELNFSTVVSSGLKCSIKPP